MVQPVKVLKPDRNGVLKLSEIIETPGFEGDVAWNKNVGKAKRSKYQTTGRSTSLGRRMG